MAADDGDVKNGANGDNEYISFKRRYLAAFFCAAASDWLKGPYIYRLYESRGFTTSDITFLFTSGYFSSAIFGAIAGMLCDAFGRRRTCLAFCGIYSVHALMHVFSNFWVLLLARILSGVATALLSCAFEAWLVAEHRKRFPQRDLAEVFSLQTQGNALTAIGSGLAAQTLVGCLFEGSMHVFVFLWTPCLHRGDKDGSVPHGLVFALYMVAMTLGGRQTKRGGVAPSLGVVFALAATVLAVPAVTANLWCNLAAFCTFEWCCGCYFPQIAMLRSRHLAETSRAATITLFRIPLNAIVVSVLLWGRALPSQLTLLWASLALAVGAAIWCSLPGDATDVNEKTPSAEAKKVK